MATGNPNGRTPLWCASVWLGQRLGTCGGDPFRAWGGCEAVTVLLNPCYNPRRRGKAGNYILKQSVTTVLLCGPHMQGSRGSVHDLLQKQEGLTGGGPLLYLRDRTVGSSLRTTNCSCFHTCTCRAPFWASYVQELSSVVLSQTRYYSCWCCSVHVQVQVTSSLCNTCEWRGRALHHRCTHSLILAILAIPAKEGWRKKTPNGGYRKSATFSTSWTQSPDVRGVLAVYLGTAQTLEVLQLISGPTVHIYVCRRRQLTSSHRPTPRG